VALCIFRVTQEALKNGVTHSGARQIAVRLAGTPSELTLRIVDDGNGFDPLSSQSPGLGLLTMRERVELEGGYLRIATAPGRGTTIEAIVPAQGVRGEFSERD
jgi:two-component system sensor histidine kinase DegS